MASVLKKPIVQQMIEDYKQLIPDGNSRIVHPGEGGLEKRKNHNQEGMQLLKQVWSQILSSWFIYLS